MSEKARKKGRSKSGKFLSGLFAKKDSSQLEEFSSKKIMVGFHLHDRTVLQELTELGDDSISTLFQRMKPRPVSQAWADVNQVSGLRWCLTSVNDVPVRIPRYVSSKEFLAEKLLGFTEVGADVNKIMFAMTASVMIRKRGLGAKPNLRVDALDPKYWSTDSLQSFSDFLKEIYEPFKSGKVMMVDKHDNPITQSTVIPPTPYEEHINIWWTEARYSYSNIPYPVFFERVTSDVELNENWLDTARATAPTALNTAVISARAALAGTEWNIVVKEIHKLLSRLNRTYRPAQQHNEAPRRLVIDSVIIPVIEFLGRQFSVETIVFNEKTDPTSIGWGPLDYVLYGDIDDVTLTECIETDYLSPAGTKRGAGGELKVGMSGAKAEASVRDPGYNTKMSALEIEEGSDEDEENEEVGSMLGEAKRPLYMDTFGAVQTGSQMLDNHKKALETRNCSVGSTVGCLCSGHEWVFFRLDTRTAGTRPHFTLLGERRVGVLRATWDEVPRVKPTQRRPSLKRFSDFTVNFDDVEEVALAAYAALTGGLRGVAFA